MAAAKVGSASDRRGTVRLVGARACRAAVVMVVPTAIRGSREVVVADADSTIGKFE